MELKNKNLDFSNINKDNKILNNNIIEKKNKENSSDEDVFFYIMTLETNGQRHQIKIFENSNASELAFNFCKTYNLDFSTMKYLKKCIKKIILHFNDTKKNEMIYLLKDNSSIQEVAEEEIITDNSLKKSGTYKKNNSNNLIINNEENSKKKKNISKENIISLLTNKQNINNNINDNINDNNKFEKKNIFHKFEETRDKEKELSKLKKIIEDEDKIKLKDYSIDCCLENESVEIFPPTEHTTKIEQKSSIKNSYSLNQKNQCDLYDKKNNWKNKKLQLNNNSNIINYNRMNKKQNYLFNLNKIQKEKNKINDIINNDLKNILLQYKNNNIKNKGKSKSRSKNKNKSKETKFEIDKDLFIKNKNYITNKKKPNSLEKIKKKTNNKTNFTDNKKQDNSKKIKNHIKINKYKYDKILTNINELKNKCFSNYYDYFLKTKNFNNILTNNEISHKFQTSYSINQDSNRSKSISQNKVNKYNMTQRNTLRNKIKKEKRMIHLNTLNHQNMNNVSKLNLNTFLKKDSNSKDKQRTVFKNKIKTIFNIVYNKKNNLFNKTINGQYLTFRNKSKNNKGKELFIESKKNNTNRIRKMVTESLLNIHKIKEKQKEKKKNTICIGGRIIKYYNNNKRKKSRNKDFFFKNESTIEKSINLHEQFYFESGNNNISINNIPIKNKRNITDIDLIDKKIIRNEDKNVKFY